MKEYKTVIIGAGFSGICLAIMLKKQGLNDFIVFEKAASLGGTWRENTYPGAECDVPSSLYSYSFEYNVTWHVKWSGQQKILQYQKETVQNNGIGAFIQYNTELVEARFVTENQHWLLTCQDGTQCIAQHLVTAVGQLHHLFTPEYEKATTFKGDVFHSGKWNHDIDLKNKRVAVIGNAASAVQFIPEIAPLVKQLTIFQRSANWVVPKVDRAYTRLEQWLSSKFIIVAKAYRFYTWSFGEVLVLPAIKGNRLAKWVLRTWSLYAMRKTISDPQLREKLTPNYPVGAKRVLFSDDYYPALTRDNVQLETNKIDSFTENGLLVNKREQPYDVIIYATGFKTNPFLAPIKIYGRDGQALSDAWQGGAHAYLGVATHGFPNLHMMYGPNTNLGHSSILIMIEAQAKYIISSMQGLNANSLMTLDVKKETEHAYNVELQQRLQKMAFSQVPKSWYMSEGKITNNWAGGTREYMRRLKEVDWHAYDVL